MATKKDGLEKRIELLEKRVSRIENRLLDLEKPSYLNIEDGF